MGNDVDFGAFVADWFLHNGNVLSGVQFAVFAVALLALPGKNVKKWLLLLPEAAAVYAAFLAVCFVITLATSAAPSDIASYLQFYLTPLTVCVGIAFVFREYRLSARTVMLSLYLTTWYLTPSLDFIIGVSIPHAGWSAFASYLLTILPRVILLAVFVIMLKKFNTASFRSGSIWPVLIFEGVCVIVCVVQSITFFAFEFEIMNYGCLLVWIAELIIYVFFYLFMRQNSMKIDGDIENAKLKSEMMLMETMTSNYDSMRMLKHDLRNQYAYIAALYEQGRDDDAKRFFKEMSHDAVEVLDVVSSGNRTVDIAVNMAAAKAARSGVKFESTCTAPAEMRFTDSDLFSLLINLFDNAVEGSARSGAEEKRASVVVYPQGNYLMIRVTNTAGGDVTAESVARGMTSKADKAAHGYGSRIVRKIALRYDGDVVYTAKNGVFCAKAMIALNDISTVMGK